RVLGAVVGGVGACGTIDIVRMVEGVRVGADNVREATVVRAETSIWEVVASNVLSQWSNPNNEPKFGRRVLGAVVGGVGACGTIDIVRMVEGVRVGADNVREATVVRAETSI
nr:hypothetical protein [Tanacetum cinerariifolium]